MRNYAYPNDVNIISGGAFSDLEHLIIAIIPENVRVIRCWSFSRCSNLEKVIALNDAIEIEKFVFSNCDLAKLTICARPGSTAEQNALDNNIKTSYLTEYL